MSGAFGLLFLLPLLLSDDAAFVAVLLCIGCVIDMVCEQKFSNTT